MFFLCGPVVSDRWWWVVAWQVCRRWCVLWLWSMVGALGGAEWVDVKTVGVVQLCGWCCEFLASLLMGGGGHGYGDGEYVLFASLDVVDGSWAA